MPATPTRKRRVEFQPRDELGPTTERMSKPDYEDVNLSKKIIRRKSDPVGDLYRGADISNDAYSAAYRWRRDFIRWRYDYLEPSNAPGAADGCMHDAISWSMVRGLTGARALDAADACGERGYALLVMMTFDEYSFSSIARVILPAAERTSALRAVKRDCARVLEALAEFYRERDIAKKNSLRFPAHSVSEEYTIV